MCKRTLIYSQTHAETSSRCEVRRCRRYGTGDVKRGGGVIILGVYKTRQRPDRVLPLTSTPDDVIESRYRPSRHKTWIKYDAYVVPNPVPEGCTGSQREDVAAERCVYTTLGTPNTPVFQWTPEWPVRRC